MAKNNLRILADIEVCGKDIPPIIPPKDPERPGGGGDCEGCLKEEDLTKELLLHILGLDEVEIVEEDQYGVQRTYKVIGEETTVHGLKTTLFEDGTFIINESTMNRRADCELYGNVVAEYDPLDENNPYVFADRESRPWHNEISSIKHAKFGQHVEPTSMAFWYTETALEDIDWTHCDTYNVTSLRATFAATNLTTYESPYMPNLETLQYAFNSCTLLESASFRDAQAHNVKIMKTCFQSCYALKTISLAGLAGTIEDCANAFSNASNSAPDMAIESICIHAGSPWLDFDSATASANMFRGCVNLEGSQGTRYDPAFVDKTYARLDAPRVAMPGYFSPCV